MVFSAVGYSA